jgi:PleD family two-component response regulator
MEADEIYRLIDLADRRLYIAKERGRNQVEPDVPHWEKSQQ